ncbi:Uncharacterised protein [uncultured archaeon]|nr:Uncharacterised protein [uncultured archaeon]
MGKKEQPKRRSKLWMIATGAALAAAGFIAIGVGYIFPSYQTKIENKYNVRILGRFSEEELSAIDGALGITYDKLPGAPKCLELIIRKMQLGNIGSKKVYGKAVSNCPLSLEEIEKAKTYQDLHPNNSSLALDTMSASSDYEAMRHLLDTHLADIEKLQADILGLKKDSYDIILIDESPHYQETVIHELSHIILEEYFTKYARVWDVFLTNKGWVSDYAENVDEDIKKQLQFSRIFFQALNLLAESPPNEQCASLLQEYKPRIERISKGMALADARAMITEDTAETLSFMLLNKEPRDKLPGVQKKMDAINNYLRETGFVPK